MSHQVITIARQAGSGGREIGKRLADKLGIAYYDNELITLAAKESGMSEKLFENIDKAPTTSLLFSVAMGSFSSMGHTFSGVNIRDRAFYIQADIIKDIAQKEPCVIIGRCANYLLKNHSGLLSVYIRAELDLRVKRISEKYNVSIEEAAKAISKTDKQRASLFGYYTNCEWSDMNNYNLVLDSQRFGLDTCVEMIKTALSSK